MKRHYKIVFALFILSLFVLSCSGRTAQIRTTSAPKQKKPIELMGYTIQAGAFAKVENAAHLTETLKAKGLDSTYFKAADGLFKVRFGNYSTREAAKQRAQSLKNAGVIEDFYIVQPEDYAVAGKKKYGEDYLREALVKTAKDFIGVPYLFGGSSADTGFDCSGLTMTVYQLNGLNLPRQSVRQYEAGDDVDSGKLQKGDLVFFAFKVRGKVSHVGIYIGDGKFIHAPSRGKNIRIDSLSSAYFREKYVGGRNFL
jgi:cell wall-associated NlpC family hydrolase